MTQEIESKKISVPWTGFDVLLFFALWLTPLLISILVTHLDGPLIQVPTHTEAQDDKDYGHPIAQLVEQSNGSPMIFLAVFFSAVVAAPLVEELLFRVLLQGWLESKLTQSQIPWASVIAIVVVSCFFAVMHMGNHDVIDVQSFMSGLVATVVFSLFIFTLGILYLVQIRNARMTDYLFDIRQFAHSRFFVFAGCLLAPLFCFALIALSAALGMFFEGVNVSPIPIFLFSLVLGILYSKTQSLLYCILLHACLNGISLYCILP